MADDVGWFNLSAYNPGRDQGRHRLIGELLDAIAPDGFRRDAPADPSPCRHSLGYLIEAPGRDHPAVIPASAA
jgi:hypothetical protein